MAPTAPNASTSFAGIGDTGPGRIASAGLALCAWMSQFAVLIVCQMPLRSGLPFSRGMAPLRDWPVTSGPEKNMTAAAVTPATTEACITDHQRMRNPLNGELYVQRRIPANAAGRP